MLDFKTEQHFGRSSHKWVCSRASRGFCSARLGGSSGQTSSHFMLCLWTFSWLPSHHLDFYFSSRLFGHLKEIFDLSSGEFSLKEVETHWQEQRENRTLWISSNDMSDEWHQILTDAKATVSRRQIETTEEAKKEQCSNDKIVAQREQCKNDLG